MTGDKDWWWKTPRYVNDKIKYKENNCFVTSNLTPFYLTTFACFFCQVV